MRKIMYGTIALFVAILIIVIIVSIRTPVEMVKYEDGVIVEDH